MESRERESNIGLTLLALACGPIAFATRNWGSGDDSYAPAFAWWLVSGALATVFLDVTVGRALRELRTGSRRPAPVPMAAGGYVAVPRRAQPSTIGWSRPLALALRGGLIVAVLAFGANTLVSYYRVPVLTKVVYETRNVLGVHDGHGDRGQPLNDLIIIVASPAGQDPQVAIDVANHLADEGWIAGETAQVTNYVDPSTVVFYVPGFDEEADFLARHLDLDRTASVRAMPPIAPTKPDGLPVIPESDYESPGLPLDGVALLLLLGTDSHPDLGT